MTNQPNQTPAKAPAQPFAPIIKPLLFLLHDESFLVAAIAFVVIAICKQVPSLAGDQQTIIGIVLLLVSLLIGRYTVGNVALTVSAAPRSSADALHQLLTALFADISTEVTNPPQNDKSSNGGSTGASGGPSYPTTFSKN